MTRSICAAAVLVVLGAGGMWAQEAPTPAQPGAQTTPDGQTPAPVMRRPPGTFRMRPRPNPDAEGRYHIGDGVTTPVVIFQVEPEYTEAARKQKVRGDCMVSLTVGVDGRPENVRVVKSITDSYSAKEKAAAAGSLDAKAMEAVERYRFRPAMFQGKPVPVDLSIAVNFQIF